MKRDKASKPLDRFRRRAAQDPFFLAHALGRFTLERGMGDGELAEFLGCGLERLPHLMACRSPDPQSQRFATDVRMIAEYVGCNEERLLLALRELSVLDTLRGLPGVNEDAPAPGLLAARQRQKNRRSDTEGGQQNDRPRGT